MKKIVVYNNLIPFKGYAAMTVFPFIFAREAYDNEWDEEYLDGIREPFEFLHYLRKED